MCSLSMRGLSLRRDEFPAPKEVPKWQSEELDTPKWRHSTTNWARWNPSPPEGTKQADSMTPKFPAWVNEVMTKPPVQPR